MPVNDPVGDMLTRIRNASRARHDKVVIPTSKLKIQIARVLKEQGYIAEYTEHDTQPQGEITLQLKYGPDKSPVITGIRRYVPVREIRPVLGGLGISILSTSQGILSDADARKMNIGGELICTVY